MEVEFDGQNAFQAAANGDFPLVVLLWGMAIAARPQPVDLLSARDENGNSVLHYAASTALDGNVSIVHFLLQQTQAAGRTLADVMDARNATGETPLIRAAHVGNLRVVDALVKMAQVDLLAADKEGKTAMHHAASEGHLWVLHNLLEACANDDRRATAWSPDLLHCACLRGHAVVVQYLLSRGFDSHAPDSAGVTPLELAQSSPTLKRLLHEASREFHEPPVKCRQTRLWVVLLYASLLFAVLSTSYYAPWWIALPLIVIMLWQSLAKFRSKRGHGHSHGGPKDPSQMHPSKRDMKIAASVSLSKQTPRHHTQSNSLLTPLIKPQPELMVGIWLGWVLAFSLFLVIVCVDGSYSFVLTDGKPFLVALGAMEAVFLVVWARLAVVCPSDPGVLQSFAQDMPVMLSNAAIGVPPPDSSHCRTCLVRKPLRSKHCAQCGVCVARMDHHCGWINRCVGYGNHRLFVVFLMLHLVTLGGFVALAATVLARFSRPSNVAADRGSALLRVWMQIPTLWRDHLLVVLVFLWGVMAFIALAGMLAQHIGNMLKNLTINETINWRRYAYFSSASPGSSKLGASAFDRGAWRNMVEFWARSGPSAVDYRQIFTIPSPHEDTKPDATNQPYTTTSSASLV
ncbi:hypothetical protein ATCC90586_007908 [Pythium insidiosum]|nr:hypothetical protein ATCC90586_007908 [Pythium insidiosum]